MDAEELKRKVAAGLNQVSELSDSSRNAMNRIFADMVDGFFAGLRRVAAPAPAPAPRAKKPAAEK